MIVTVASARLVGWSFPRLKRPALEMIGRTVLSPPASFAPSAMLARAPSMKRGAKGRRRTRDHMV